MNHRPRSHRTQSWVWSSKREAPSHRPTIGHSRWIVQKGKWQFVSKWPWISNSYLVWIEPNSIAVWIKWFPFFLRVAHNSLRLVWTGASDTESCENKSHCNAASCLGKVKVRERRRFAPKRILTQQFASWRISGINPWKILAECKNHVQSRVMRWFYLMVLFSWFYSRGFILRNRTIVKQHVINRWHSSKQNQQICVFLWRFQEVVFFAWKTCPLAV